jgi:hypothetical protein
MLLYNNSFRTWHDEPEDVQVNQMEAKNKNKIYGFQTLSDYFYYHFYRRVRR